MALFLWIHVDCEHFHLLIKRKLQITKKVMAKVFETSHSWYLDGIKGLGHGINNQCIFLGQWTFTKMVMKHNKVSWRFHNLYLQRLEAFFHMWKHVALRKLVFYINSVHIVSSFSFMFYGTWARNYNHKNHKLAYVAKS